MISSETQVLLGTLPQTFDRPLLICDVDEVVVHFVKRFEAFAAPHGLYFEPGDISQSINFRHARTKDLASPELIGQLVSDFFDTQTSSLELIDGAAEALRYINAHAEIIFLTNIPHAWREKRLANLAGHGLPFPLITNSGPKGPAIANLAARTKQPVVFIDDSSGFLNSSRDHAPQVHRIQFLHDARIAPHITPEPDLSLLTNSWQQARDHISSIVT